MRSAGGWWIGWVEEVPGVNCQAKTRAGLLRSLRVTLKEALEMTGVGQRFKAFAKVEAAVASFRRR